MVKAIFAMLFVLAMPAQALTLSDYSEVPLRGFSESPNWERVYNAEKPRGFPVHFSSRRALIRAVNANINRSVRYLADEVGFDYWQTRRETSVWQTGDCEDYAIAKWQALRDHGIPDDDMRLVLMFWRGEGHMVLAVKAGRTWNILDSVQERPTPYVDLEDRIPLRSYGPSGTSVYYAASRLRSRPKISWHPTDPPWMPEVTDFVQEDISLTGIDRLQFTEITHISQPRTISAIEGSIIKRTH